MATPSHGERPGLLHFMYKHGSGPQVNTASTMANWIVQNIYDTEEKKGLHRQELIDCITIALGLFGGTI